jgi:hypothetical protein
LLRHAVIDGDGEIGGDFGDKSIVPHLQIKCLVCIASVLQMNKVEAKIKVGISIPKSRFTNYQPAHSKE